MYRRPTYERVGVTITPTLASASSSATRCASVAPAIVILIVLSVFASTSFFKEIRVAMMSALPTFTTRGIVPYNGVSDSIKTSQEPNTYIGDLMEPFANIAGDLLGQ